eukprot:1665009-Lingulodinium_polyedra.AAC.1
MRQVPPIARATLRRQVSFAFTRHPARKDADHEDAAIVAVAGLAAFNEPQVQAVGQPRGEGLDDCATPVAQAEPCPVARGWLEFPSDLQCWQRRPTDRLLHLKSFSYS